MSEKSPIQASIEYANAKALATELEVPEAEVSSEGGEFVHFLEYQPQPVNLFVPKDGAEHKKAFLDGSIENFNHEYARLDAVNFTDKIEQLETTSRALALGATETQALLYRSMGEDYVKKTQFLQAAHDFKHAQTEEDKEAAKKRYMDLNIELYGEPDKDTYDALLSDKLKKIQDKSLTGRAAELRDELFAMVGDRISEDAGEMFKPSDDTVEWAQKVAEALYWRLLKHIPKRETYTVEEARDIFETILREEFNGVADQIQVVVEPASGMNFGAAEGKFTFPVDRKPLKYNEMRKLASHEIGVHILRHLQGASTDVGGLAFGTAKYYDAEEGLGVVMEQALEGKFTQRGIPYYMVASAMYHDGLSTREVFERQWRLDALESLTDEDITDVDIEKKRSLAYGRVMRIARGTDELPWFKDLSYFNGSESIWKYLEENRGDEDALLRLLAIGKLNPTVSDDLRIALESKSL